MFNESSHNDTSNFGFSETSSPEQLIAKERKTQKAIKNKSPDQELTSRNEKEYNAKKAKDIKDKYEGY